MDLTPTQIRNSRPGRWGEFAGAANARHFDRFRSLAARRQLNGRFLIVAPYGSAKTSLGRLLVKAACCPHVSPHTGDPCGTCDSCTKQGPDYNGQRHTRSHWEIDCTHTPRPEAVELAKELRAERDAVVFWDEFQRYDDRVAETLLKTAEDHEGLWIIAVAEGRQNPDLFPLWERFDTIRLQRPTFAELVDHFQAKLPEWGVQASRPVIEMVVTRSKGSFRTCLNTFAAAAENEHRTLDEATVNDEFASQHTTPNDYLVSLD